MGSSSSRVHGACMVAAWIGSSSCGQMIAKHYRPAFPKRKVAGKDFWFAAHMALMLLTVLLTAISFVVIYVYRGQQSVNTHSILGLIVGILTFLQPIAAFFRPAPNAAKRFWFNWGHWLVGNLAHALAVVNLFLAVNFRTVKEKTGYAWILTVYTVLHVLADYLLQKIPKEAKIAGASNGIVAEAVQQIEMNLGSKADNEEKPKMAQKLAKNAPKLAKFILFGYIFVCVFCAFLLVLIVGNIGAFGQHTAAPNATAG